MIKGKSQFNQSSELPTVATVTLDASGQMMLREYPSVIEELLDLAQLVEHEVSKLVAATAQKVLFQLDYWFNRAHLGQEREGQKWLRISLREMCSWAFRFVSISTLSRAVNLLETLGLIKVENLNRHRYDQTRWYTLDPEGLSKLTTFKVVTTSIAEEEAKGRESVTRLNAMLAEDEAAAATVVLAKEMEIEKAFQAALADLCHMDISIKRNREKVESVAQELLKQGYERLHLIWFERYWKYHCWITKKPGKQNEIPTLSNVTQLLTRAVEKGEREGWGETYY